jgi:hypothetical protein
MVEHGVSPSVVLIRTGALTISEKARTTKQHYDGAK